MLSNGRFRIGTLHEYRNVEQHGQWVGDAAEGTLVRTYKNTIEKFVPGKPIPKGLTPFYGNTNESATFTVIGGEFTYRETSPDYYIFSVSTSFDKSVMHDLGYDACIRIVRPTRFFKALTQKLRKKIQYGHHGLFACVYRGRTINLNNEPYIFPALIKEPRYEAQKEMRYVWEPKAQEITPKIINCVKAKAYCELLDVT